MSVYLEEIIYDEDPKALKEWIAKGGDPSEFSNWALDYANRRNLKTMIDILSKNPKVKNFNNFMDAIKKGDLEAVKRYHAKGVSIFDNRTENTAVKIAREKGFGEIEEFLYEDPRIRLQQAVYDRDVPQIVQLLQDDFVFNEIGIEDVLGNRFFRLYEQEDERRKKGFLDTTIAMRDLPVDTWTGTLPPHVLADIIYKAYGEGGALELGQIIPKIERIFKFPREADK